MKIIFSTLFIATFFLVSCNDENFEPKPKSYPRVHLPKERGFKLFDNHGPFTFEYPVYATVTADTNFMGSKPENPWWVNISIPSLNAKIHLSYKTINQNPKTFYQLLEDTYQLSFKHSVKAAAIDRSSFHPSNGVAGQMFLVRGNAASSNQFYITDSVNNFVRGALYFYAEPNEDSLAPATRFVLKDIEHLITTFRWNNTFHNI